MVTMSGVRLRVTVPGVEALRTRTPDRALSPFYLGTRIFQTAPWRSSTCLRWCSAGDCKCNNSIPIVRGTAGWPGVLILSRRGHDVGLVEAGSLTPALEVSSRGMARSLDRLAGTGLLTHSCPPALIHPADRRWSLHDDAESQPDGTLEKSDGLPLPTLRATCRLPPESLDKDISPSEHHMRPRCCSSLLPSLQFRHLRGRSQDGHLPRQGGFP